MPGALHFRIGAPVINESQIPAAKPRVVKNMKMLWASLLVAVMGLTLGGCAAKPDVDQASIDLLALEIQRLGPEVSPEEAERAAHIAYTYSLQLAQEYQVTDLPIIHNAKVHNGKRERGLCNDYAEDMEIRLKQEGFRTLAVHRAIAPPTTFRIIHHTAVISERGGTMQEGIVLDPWRYGGALFWSPTGEDPRYNWRPRMEVREELIRARKEREAALNG